nr:DciA family protein [uncultured Neokomagataea sp.]
MTQVTQPTFKKKSPILVRLALNWPDFVGPYLAQQTEPRRLSAGTLTLACAGPVAMELQHQSVQLLERINTACGLRGVHAIERLKLVQDHTLRPVAPRVKKRLPAVSVEGVENDELRAALERLGGHIKLKRTRR